MTTPTATKHGLTAGTWTIDPTHTRIGAVARHLMVTKVRGHFESFSGTIEVGDTPQDSSVNVSIDTSSITTGTDDRDAHLKSPDFLDVENHPHITFESTEIAQVGDRYKLVGDLTIRGATNPIELDMEFLGVHTDPWGNQKAAFEARGTLEREKWGLVWNVALESGGVLVSKTFDLEIELQAGLQA